MDATDLHVVLVRNILELLLVLRQLRELDVHGRSQASAEVGRAGRNVSKMVVMRELSHRLEGAARAAQTVEHGFDVGTLLHRDNSELVFLVHPDQEGLGVVVEDAAARGPVAVQVRVEEEAVALLEEEVVSDELVLHVLGHALERVEFALQLALERVHGLHDFVHDIEALLLGDARAEREAVEVAGHADTGGQDHGGVLFGEVGVFEAFRGHVGLVRVVLLMSVVVLDHLVEELAEFVVGVVGARVHADARIHVLHARENAGFERDSVFVAQILVLVPHVLRQSLRQQRLGAGWQQQTVVLHLGGRAVVGDLGVLGRARRWRHWLAGLGSA